MAVKRLVIIVVVVAYLVALLLYLLDAWGEGDHDDADALAIDRDVTTSRQVVASPPVGTPAAP